jgi:hypothetical protein
MFPQVNQQPSRVTTILYTTDHTCTNPPEYLIYSLASVRYLAYSLAYITNTREQS